MAVTLHFIVRSILKVIYSVLKRTAGGFAETVTEDVAEDVTEAVTKVVAEAFDETVAETNFNCNAILVAPKLCVLNKFI